MSFSCLIAVARTCSTILNANGKSWHSYPVEKFGTFHHWVWCWLWVSHIRMVCIGFACGSAGKETAHNVGDLGSIPGLGRSPAEGKGYPLQYPSLENSTDCNLQGPHSLGFSRQEYWSGLPFPSPEDRPNPGIEPRSPTLQADSLPTELLVPVIPPTYQNPRMLKSII